MIVTIRYRGRKIVVTVPNENDEIAIDVSTVNEEKKLIIL